MTNVGTRVMMYSITFTVMLLDGKYMTSYLMALAMFTSSLTVCKIFTNEENWKTLTLNMKVKGRKTGFLPFDWKYLNPYRWFFRILATWEHTFSKLGQIHTFTRVQGNTFTHTRTHACTHARTDARTHARTHAHTHTHKHKRSHLMTKGEICYALQICLKRHTLPFQSLILAIRQNLYRRCNPLLWSSFSMLTVEYHHCLSSWPSFSRSTIFLLRICTKKIAERQ